MNKYTVILLSFLSCSGFLSQQNETIGRPSVFNDGLISTELHEKYLINPKADYTDGLMIKSSNSPWVAWSDRSQNPISQLPNQGSSIVTYLSFMQPVSVIDRNDNGWLKVKAHKKGTAKQYIGWIQGRFLQLTPYALEKNGISRKAVVLANGDFKFNVDTTDETAYKSLTKVFAKPIIESKYHMSKESQTFKIYFIIKETKDFYLLSEYEEFKNASNPIYGWMPKMNVTEWKSRVCYGTNFGSDAMAAYPGELPFSNDPKKKKKLLKWDPKKKSQDSTIYDVAGIKVQEDEMNFYYPRYPDLTEDSEETDLRLVQVILKSSGIMKSDQVADMESIINEIENLKKRISHINLIFVIDATSSMRTYYSGIAQAIDNVCESLSEFKKNTIKTVNITLGFYRDYADEDSFELIGTNPYSLDMTRELKNIPRESVGEDWYEAMYHGLTMTFKESPRIERDHNNLIILIGDDGNDQNISEDFVKRQEINQIIKDYNAKLFAFQATTRYTDASMQFQKDVLKWIDQIHKNSINSKDFSIQSLDDNHSQYGLELINEEVKNYGDTYGKLITNSGNPGQKTDPIYLQNQLEEDIISWTEAVELRLQELEDVGINANFNDCYDNKIRAGLSPSTAKFVCTQGRDQTMAAYTVAKSKYSETPCLYHYVLLTKSEFISLRDAFNNFVSQTTVSDRQVALQKLFVHLIAKAYGSDSQTILEMKSMNLGDLWYKLFQMELGIEELRDYSVNNIADIEIDIVNDIYYVAKEFVTLDEEDYRWKRLHSDSQVFYWIPADYFPGYHK